jgi:DNA polymerase zeta
MYFLCFLLLSSPPSLPPGIPLLQVLSRTPTERPSGRNNAELNGFEHESGIFITGRIVLNMWKRMKSELKLQSYSKHHVAQQLLGRKVGRCMGEDIGY